MYCSKCGIKAGIDSKYCANCGTEFAEKETEKKAKFSSQSEIANESTSSDNGTKTGPTGLGGWLMLLVMGMIALGPLMGAGRLYSDFVTAELQYPNISTMDIWKTFKSATWWAFFINAAISFYGGFILANGRNLKVVSQAKIILWITGPVASIVMAILIPFIIFGKAEPSDPKFFGGFVASLVAASIWTAYLSKSKRVRNTYGNFNHNTEGQKDFLVQTHHQITMM